jgi:hypothetical protein
VGRLFDVRRGEDEHSWARLYHAAVSDPFIYPCKPIANSNLYDPFRHTSHSSYGHPRRFTSYPRKSTTVYPRIKQLSAHSHPFMMPPL